MDFTEWLLFFSFFCLWCWCCLLCVRFIFSYRFRMENFLRAIIITIFTILYLFIAIACLSFNTLRWFLFFFIHIFTHTTTFICLIKWMIANAFNHDISNQTQSTFEIYLILSTAFDWNLKSLKNKRQKQYLLREWFCSRADVLSGFAIRKIIKQKV